MNPHEHDNRIQQLFSEQRVADQQRAPSFQQTWQAAMTRAANPARTSWWWPVTVTTGAALLLIAAVWWWPQGERPQPTVAADTTMMVSIHDWTSPTDSLLEPLSWSASTGTQP